MRSFIDSKGRTWDLAITIGDVKRIRARLDIDLLAMTDPKQNVLAMLSTDVVRLCDVLFVLLEPKAAAANISDEAFGQSLGGEVIAHAMECFWGELADFFRGAGQMASAAAIEKQQHLIRAAMEWGEKKILAIDLDPRTGAISGGGSSDSRASPASTMSTA